jgi:LuxR family maltose regulon positive regulatory protein
VPGIGPLGAAEAYYMAGSVWIRVQIAAGKPQAAQSYITRQIALAEAYGLTSRVIELSLLQALAAQAEGDSDRTWAALEHALLAGLPEGYVRIFDQGAILTQLLGEAAQRGIFQEYIGQILNQRTIPDTDEIGRRDEAALQSSTPVLAQSPDLESNQFLSERELDVLRLMAQGASNQEIAEQLVITVGTVKSHITHILGKLDAENRTKAVARARELGLLEI